MAVVTTPTIDERKQTTAENYSPIIGEARAIFDEYGVRDIQTALKVLAVRELQKVNERLDRLTAADSAAEQSETEQPRRGRPRKDV